LDVAVHNGVSALESLEFVIDLYLIVPILHAVIGVGSSLH
jgi:hypothetical protein